MLKGCKLSKKVHAMLLEYFILEVTARSVTERLDIQVNSSALFHRKISELIC
jgi:transposase